MKEKLKTIGIIIGVILLIVSGGYYWLINALSVDEKEGQLTEEQIEAAEEYNESAFEMEQPPADGKSADALFGYDMSEFEVQASIHAMSHQKVESDRKWGQLQMTAERVKKLNEIVNENRHYEHSHIYMDILSRWVEGDFSQADKDHNLIWRLQGGNVGEATGLLSSFEEQEFIEQHFE